MQKLFKQTNLPLSVNSRPRQEAARGPNCAVPENFCLPGPGLLYFLKNPKQLYKRYKNSN